MLIIRSSSFVSLALLSFFPSIAAVAQDTQDSPVVCFASAKSSQNVVFDYFLVGEGQIGADGYLSFADESPRFSANLRQAPKWTSKVLIDSVKPLYRDSGLGHERHDIPGSVYGMIMEISHYSSRFGISHRISETETIYASGDCKLVANGSN